MGRRTMFDSPAPASSESSYHPSGYVRPQLRTAAWQRVRTLTLARDLYTCQHCGYIGPRLTVDHRTPHELYHGSHNDPANLWTLCARCAASKGDHESVAAWHAALRRRGKL